MSALRLTSFVIALSTLTVGECAQAQVPLDSPEALITPWQDLSILPDEGFGTAIATDGDTLMIGAPGRSTSNGLGKDQVLVYTRTPNNDWLYSQTLELEGPLATTAVTRFGEHIAISGDIAIINAPQWPTGNGPKGLVCIFERSPLDGWQLSYTEHVVGVCDVEIEGNRAVFVNTTSLVRVRDRVSASEWSRNDTGQMPYPFTVENYSDVALSGDRLVATGTGEVFPYPRTVVVIELQASGTWLTRDRLDALDYAPFGGQWGLAVALDGDTLLVSAPSAQMSSVGTGAIFAYQPLTPSLWLESEVLTATSGAPTAVGPFDFGARLEVEAGRLAVGGVAGAPLHLYDLDSQGHASLAAVVETAMPQTTSFGTSIGLSSDALVVATVNTPARASFFETLRADTPEVSLSSPGPVHLTVAAGPLRPSHAFIMLGSLSGTGPGTWLDSTTLLPLNADAYTQLTVGLMAPLDPGVGITDGQGVATSRFYLPPSTPASLVGSTVHHAALVVDLTTFELTTTNAVATDILP
jgi:hypothetical protein